jgi:hypothetical protein
LCKWWSDKQDFLSHFAWVWLLDKGRKDLIKWVAFIRLIQLLSLIAQKNTTRSPAHII